MIVCLFSLQVLQRNIIYCSFVVWNFSCKKITFVHIEASLPDLVYKDCRNVVVNKMAANISKIS